MPFEMDTLPEPVTELPKDAQMIWLSVFNSAFRTFAGSDGEKEQASSIAAWGAVRSKFAQEADGTWTMKSAISFEDPRGSEPEHGRWTRAVKFTPNLLEAKKRITYGEVYAPWTVDAQGEFADEGAIEDAAHNFLKHFGTIGEQHRLFGGKGVPVESFTSRPKDGDFPVPGTWVLGTQWSEEMWQKILNGEITGYSLGGDWTRMPLVAGREYAKKILVDGGKDAPALAELDEALFEQTVNAGPRMIAQIIKLNVDEVSGVSLPANRQPFKLFKGMGGRSMKRAVVVGNGKGGKCSCEEEKASPGSPWLKLYENFIQFGLPPDKAREEVERILGKAPEGTWLPKGKDALSDCIAEKMKDSAHRDKFPDQAQALAVAFSVCGEGKTNSEETKAMEPMTFAEVVAKADELHGAGNGAAIASLLQAKYLAGPEGGIALPEGTTIEDAITWAVEQGTTAGIFSLKEAPAAEEQVTLLKQVTGAVKSIARFLGVKAEGSEEDDAMTTEERKEFDALKATMTDKCAAFEKALDALKPAAAVTEVKAAETTTAAAEPVAAEAKGGDGAYVPTAGEMELHARVKELESTLAAIRSQPGTSQVEQVVLNPEAVTAGKSIEGYRHSSILGTAIPISAGQVELKANVERMKKLQDRRNSYGVNRGSVNVR
jgi:cation transport regulator ChaB